MDTQQNTIHIVGKKIASIPTPLPTKVIYFISYLLTYFFFCSLSLFILSILRPNWIETDLKLLISILTCAIFFYFFKKIAVEKPLTLLIGLQRSPEHKTKVMSFRDSVSSFWLRPIFTALVLISCIYFSINKLDENLTPLKIHLNTHVFKPNPVARTEVVYPVYFWDIATWISANTLLSTEIVIPYHKGPPNKLLPKILFKNKETKLIELEINGKRPRNYPIDEVQKLFSIGATHSPVLTKNLIKETGVDENFITLNQIEHTQNTKTFLIGDNLDTLDSSKGIIEKNHSYFHAAFLGNDGGLFQIQCLIPCVFFKRSLELSQLAPDPKGSRLERIQWTTATLSQEIKLNPSNADEKKLHEAKLILYLASLISLDPRDPEAFFHLGKLSNNKETILSMIQYGRDLGLEAAKLTELSTEAAKRTQ